MGSNYLAILGVTTVTTVMSCSPAKKEYASFELYPVRTGSLTEMEYTPLATKFYLWSPTAEEVRLMLYDAGEGGHAYETVKMEPTEDGTWTTSVDENLLGKFYAFNVKINDKWQGDTPGINAHAVGVNGKRAAIIDWKTTNPEGWESDRRPSLKSPADMIIYEMHHRDFSVDSTSGIKNKGKYLALTEHGTMNSDKLLTGIDHLIELGVTHVHLLPSSDYASIDETKLEENHYNWGYDPANYNVPDGSYSTDPYQPATRVKEFKQMVQALHRAGIRVIMDVGLSSRNLKDEEVAKGLTQTVLAYDGIAIIVNPENPVADLDIDTIARIYKGEIKNWSEVGGNDAEIVLIGREAGSGTRDGFESITGTEDACVYRQELTSTGDVITTVAQNPDAIGYASLASVKDSVKALSVGGVAPAEDTVKDGSYVIQRPFVLVTKDGVALSATARKFFDYITSADAASIISEAGAVAAN